MVIAILARIRAWCQGLAMTQEVTGRLVFMSEVEHGTSGINRHTDNGWLNSLLYVDTRELVLEIYS
jgi:hypothetical protein